MVIVILKVTRKNEIILKLSRPGMRDQYFRARVGEHIELKPKLSSSSMDLLSTEAVREYDIEV